jgi:type IV secretory pathway VirB6-like protein
MSKPILPAVLAAMLTAAPLPGFVEHAAAQTAQTQSTNKAKTPSAALAATRERQRKCGAEWREAKAAGKVEKGMTWPKYWSACNKRLKAENKS